VVVAEELKSVGYRTEDGTKAWERGAADHGGYLLVSSPPGVFDLVIFTDAGAVKKNHHIYWPGHARSRQPADAVPDDWEATYDEWLKQKLPVSIRGISTLNGEHLWETEVWIEEPYFVVKLDSAFYTGRFGWMSVAVWKAPKKLGIEHKASLERAKKNIEQHLYCLDLLTGKLMSSEPIKLRATTPIYLADATDKYLLLKQAKSIECYEHSLGKSD